MLILGIETSCDETAVAVVEDGKKIHSNLVASQVQLHKEFHGIVPEVASRKHLEVILPLLKESLKKASFLSEPAPDRNKSSGSSSTCCFS